jgi:hypothetical protein
MYYENSEMTYIKYGLHGAVSEKRELYTLNHSQFVASVY